ncbi:MAG: hypothetical protein SAJ72_24690 [Jaaginema sp. PMC 1080.18]|nr:hypothetical protein [Jaaginema sp. PMC 1080.18]
MNESIPETARRLKSGANTTKSSRTDGEHQPAKVGFANLAGDF